jgi:small-conductance mechanosensitive channel
MTTLVWLFAMVVAYPYLPGSQTDAFKGVSVFIGLLVTFGSSGLVNQIMSGFMITYSRALRVGDYVKIGDVEGTVMHLGVLSTKIKTLRREEVTVPNAVVVATTTTDYSRTGDTDGVLTPTSVTIGYDTPWRQVQALLLLAAERTPGLRQEPKPVVIQAELEDFYVKYSLFVSLKRQQTRFVTLNALHANIQDLFNEYGVQIMSPNYVLDPAAAKVVPKKGWFAAPARPDPPQQDT